MGFFRDWRRRRLLQHQPLPAAPWRALCDSVPLLAVLDADECDRLRERAAVFLAEKTVHGVQGQELDEEQRWLIAALATLPILNLDDDWYGDFYEVIVYPDEFIPRHEVEDEHGLVHERHMPLSGESWPRGPVILSWADVEASLDLNGYNVVIHEFAHKLDMRNGDANGMPPLHHDMVPAAWTEAFTSAYEQLNADLDAGRDTLIDPYAAEDPAEFFAVLSEAFFEIPDYLRPAFPAVYEQLSAFYRQDPARRNMQAYAAD
jgi:Mlc titration factor MtfA (ptsG expression regulator)